MFGHYLHKTKHGTSPVIQCAEEAMHASTGSVVLATPEVVAPTPAVAVLIVHLGPLLTSIKGRSRALVRKVAAREDRLTNRLSPSHANACNPLLQAHPPWAQDNTSRGSLFPPCVPSRADPSGLGHAATIYSSVQGPPGVETPTKTNKR
jgi:hypothetical protein